MQGLRPLSSQQDENSFAHFQPSFGSKSFAGRGETFAGKSFAVLPGQRKALGNITNRGFENESTQPSKTPGMAKRRAFGDITNSSVSSRLQQKTVTAELSKSHQPAVAAAACVGKAEMWAEEGVEHMAGKGWHQLDFDRRKQVDEDIDERLLAFSTLNKHSIPNFFPCWGTKLTAPSAGLQKEQLPSLPPSPCYARQLQASSLDMDLGDLELPEVNFALPDDDLFLRDVNRC